MIKIINMKTWLSRDEALELLKVRPQTLYAYVSRGQIGMRPDPDDPRRNGRRISVASPDDANGASAPPQLPQAR